MIKYFFLLFMLISFAACQELVEGCMHPRAINFNPEADSDIGCTYYQIQLLSQYGYNSNPLDTFFYGTVLSDADGTPFTISQMPFLISHVHLVRVGTGEEKTSPEDLTVFDRLGNPYYTEDNFGIIEAGSYTESVASWVELGDFDKVRFRVGVPDNVRNTNPSRVERNPTRAATSNNHPLSTSASTYMYDSTAMAYATSFVDISLPNTTQSLRFNFFENWDIELPYSVTAIDGVSVGVNLRLNYAALFDGVSFTNDDSTTIHNKIVQNLSTAFSTY